MATQDGAGATAQPEVPEQPVHASALTLGKYLGIYNNHLIEETYAVLQVVWSTPQ